MPRARLTTLVAGLAPALLAALCAAPARAGEPAGGPYTLDSSKGKDRVLLVFAPSGRDARYRSQMMWTEWGADGLKDRSIRVVEVFENGRSRTADRPISEAESKSIRDRFKVGKDQFLVVLVGKDGTEKFRDEAVLRMETVFAKVDEMPMRKAEMKKDQG